MIDTLTPQFIAAHTENTLKIPFNRKDTEHFTLHLAQRKRNTLTLYIYTADTEQFDSLV